MNGLKESLVNYTRLAILQSIEENSISDEKYNDHINAISLSRTAINSVNSIENLAHEHIEVLSNFQSLINKYEDNVVKQYDLKKSCIEVIKTTDCNASQLLEIFLTFIKESEPYMKVNSELYENVCKIEKAATSILQSTIA